MADTVQRNEDDAPDTGDHNQQNHFLRVDTEGLAGPSLRVSY
jgi:hypothetical protein